MVEQNRVIEKFGHSEKERLDAGQLKLVLSLEPWWEIPYLRVNPKEMTLEAAVAGIFSCTVAEADDYFDSSMQKWYGLKADEFREHFLGLEIRPSFNQEISFQVNDVMNLVLTVINSLGPDTRGRLLNAYNNFLSEPFSQFENINPEFLKTYSEKQAMEYKKGTQVPYLRLIYLLRMNGYGDEQRVGEFVNLMMGVQSFDDYDDFDEDSKGGSINIAIGLFHDYISKGYSEVEAKILAKKACLKLVKPYIFQIGVYMLKFGIRSIFRKY